MKRSKFLRFTCLSLSLLLVWTFLLAAPLQALAQQPASPKAHKPIVAKPHDDPAWHTIDYHAAEHAPYNPLLARANHLAARRYAQLTLLDEVGHLSRTVDPAEPRAWQHQLHRANPNAPQHTAALHIRLAEYRLAHDEQPEEALWHLQQAQALTNRSSELYGLAAYDRAIALFYEGAYESARAAFLNLLTTRPGLHGFDHRTAALWMRHAGACAGYHQERAQAGIPEPPRLDPLCGAAAVAESLKAAGRAFDRRTVLSHLRVTGRGSSMQDVVVGARRMGLSPHVVHADDKGLIALPKPAVAYVEHDHFISVLKADKQGVTYLCSDCGPWPGGSVHLSWKQWHQLEATAYVALLEPGSDEDAALSALATPEGARGAGVQMASAVWSRAGAGRFYWLRRFRQGITAPDGGETDSCGYGPGSQQCNPYIGCPMYCPDQSSSSPLSGEPVNLSTGEEEYTPQADITVYNPIGPSVTWRRLYDSLRGYNPAYENSDFGQGWSHSYNLGVYVSGVSGTVYTTSVVFPNGAQITFVAPSAPSATQLRVACTVPNGIGLAIEWDYDTSTSKTYYRITDTGRNQWTTQEIGLPPLQNGPGGGANEIGVHPNISKFTPTLLCIATLTDNNANSILFNYGAMNLLSNIADKNGVALLTFNRATNGTGNLTSVSDRYGCSVYYQVNTYANQHVGSGYPQSQQELTDVSQIVPTGTTSPANRYVYGYQNYGNGEQSETVPFLHTITVPSATGTGAATATLNYLSGVCTLLNVVDANGNTVSFTQTNANHTKVSIAAPNGTVAYSYTVGYDMFMNQTTVTDGTNSTIIESNTFSDSNDPYRPSSVTDGNGKITEMVWDQYGNLHQSTSPRGTVTNSTWAFPVANSVVNSIVDTTLTFGLGELRQTQEGTKTPTKFVYYEPSGNIETVSSPTPGSASGSNTWVETNYTWSTLGNLLTVVAPGNNADQTITTTYNYTTDGSYTQTEALGQPITITDNLGEVSHLRYDNQQIDSSDPLANTGQIKSVTDALGNVSNLLYNLANQTTSLSYPPTGQTGTGSASTISNYLYPGGPLTNQVDYDENGNPVVDASGKPHQVTYNYGLEGETLSVTGSTQPYTVVYDAAYRTVQLQDGNYGAGHLSATTYQYNTAGYLGQVSYPNANGNYDTIQYTSYDNAGNLLTRIDGRGLTTTYTHNTDPESLLTAVQYTGYAALNVGLAYDSYGRTSQVTDSIGSRTFNYDDLDNPLDVPTTYTALPAGHQSFTPTYQYYPDGSRQSLSVPELSLSYGYQYDGVGRMNQLTNPQNETFTWSYLANGWLGQRISKNATGSIVAGTFNTYNARGFLTELTNRTASNAILSDYGGAIGSGNEIFYDAVGNPRSQLANLPGTTGYSGLTSYTHDFKNQVTSEQSARFGSYSQTNVFDGAGNPTTLRSTANIGYNIDNQFSSASFVYDGNGNATTYNGVACTFDPENRMTAYGTMFTAGYFAEGTRGWKQNSSGTTYFLYDGSDLICELNSSGAVTAVNSWGADGLVSRHTSTGSVFYTFDPDGNVAQRLDSNANVLGSYGFDAFGTRTSTDNTADPYSGFEAQDGYYRDSETGAYLCGYRYYDANAGRFINRDPISYEGGINLYAYCENSPFDGTDPSGLQTNNQKYWTVHSPTKKRARERAQHHNGGNSPPLHHPNDQNGGLGHYHPTNPATGRKIPGPHYTYPKQGPAVPTGQKKKSTDPFGPGFVIDCPGLNNPVRLPVIPLPPAPVKVPEPIRFPEFEIPEFGFGFPEFAFGL